MTNKTILADLIETKPCRYGQVSYLKQDLIIGRSLREYGEWAQAEVEFLLDLLNPGDTVVDVGAFIGTHTLAFSRRVGTSGLVFSFEPQALVFEILKQNITQNELTNVKLNNIALGAKDATIYVRDSSVSIIDYPASFSLSSTMGLLQESNDIPIKVARLDKYKLSNCQLIKIDAEGMEPQVLRGAINTLRRLRPVVFCECLSVDNGAKLLALMSAEGYEAFLYCGLAYNPGNFNGSVDNFFGEGREVHIVFVPSETAPLFPSRSKIFAQLIPVRTLDDLVLVMLKKPQYKTEVLENISATKILGTDFWANESEKKQLHLHLQQLQANCEQRDGLVKELQSYVAEKDQTVQVLSVQLAEKEQAVQTLTAQVKKEKRVVQTLTAQVKKKEQAVQSLSNQLREITSSKAWRAAMLLRRIRVFLLPPGSWRARMARKIVTFLLIPLTIRRTNKTRRDLALIRNSGLFDRDWYLTHNPDMARSGMDPEHHYLLFGGFEGRDPSAKFASKWYLETYQDVQRSGLNPLVHYLRHGKNEGRLPSPHQTINTNSQNSVSSGSKFSHSLWMMRRYLLQHHRLLMLMRAIIPHPVRQKINNYLQGNNYNADDTLSSREGSPMIVNAEIPEENLREYKVLLQKILEIAQQHTEEVSVKAPRLISFGDDDHLTLMQVAQSIKFQSSETPNVSIVIPVYNNAKLLLECLHTLQNDTAFNNFEICVVDDFSDDENRKIIESITGIKVVRNQERNGFARACNIGAQVSKGEFLVFLNDDAQVTKDAISSLLHTFKMRPDVGAVGPKVLYFSGFLQEAGCTINPDGTIALIGHGDDPELPRYNYLREVDYVSGVCLMMKKDHFDTVGGFEEAYTPAYYEDVDLCLKLRKKGLKNFYNPDAVVVHHLSATVSGLYGQETKLDLVARNRQKLLERWQPEIDELNQIRLIAFYLPQFHPIPENDLWWGKGFTEWNNVVRARPYFDGHYQPHLPADLGFYDLRVAEIMEQQAELAKRYGIYGFCYYYYWFNGKRLLEMPLERMLETGRPDFPFCLCWANENWSRRWDGGEKDILIAQKHSDEDDLSIIRDLIRYFIHPNYIRVDGKPIFLVYRVDIFPDFKRTTRIWREECLRQGIGEIYLVMAETFGLSLKQYDPKEFGVEATVEFPPHGYWEPIRPANMASTFEGHVMDYKNTALHFMTKNFPGFFYYKTVMPSWDNTPRRGKNAVVFANSSPGAYQAWLEAAIRRTHEQYAGDHRIVFINAWNEWAEGNHLEPDLRYGHGLLEATKNAIESHLIHDDYAATRE